MIFGGRYLIFMMSLFSMYVGLIYNDSFSLPMFFGSSGWTLVESPHENHYTFDRTYSFGIDPIWHLADNSLLFLNSYKMKLSVILGILQMTFGIVLSVFNSLYFRKPINIYCEFIPQVLFLTCSFGYLVIIIIYKWLRSDFGTYLNAEGVLSNRDPPGLLNTLIFMFLKPGTVEPADQLYSGQGFIQMILVLVALVCVPWMLLVKPYLLRKQHQKEVEEYGLIRHESPKNSEDGSVVDYHNEPSAGTGHGHGHGEFDFGEIVVHQVIHTIEFCLGAISNTASYLRLWALSLAHARNYC
jgi:V-type H+-transporting ATPase subunit a